MKIHYISAEKLTFERIEQVFNENYQVQLSSEAIAKIQKCRDYLDNKMKTQKEPIYGITTGFGALHDRTISKDQLSDLQRNLVISHACGTGDEIDPKISKLMLLLKAHALSLGHSGVQVETVQRILDMFNHDIIPVVYQLGSLGASGDLSPLAHLFLPLIGEGEVYYQGKKQASADVFAKLNLTPIKLQSKEGLALLNGTQFMSAHGTWAVIKAKKLSQFADVVGAMSLDAFDGRLDPFMDRLHQIRPHNGQIETAANFRKILGGSEIISRPKKHVQDPYSFRCIPQVHGATKDTIAYAASVLLTEINSVTDNPTIFPEDDLIVSGGNFHGQPLALIFDFLAIAMAELGSISERRIYRLISGQRELPEFLTANPGVNSGFMIPQYTAASIVSQNKQLCSPSSVDSIPSSNEQEDHVSMGANAATKLLRVLDNLERILGIELLNSAQALEFRKPLKTSPFLTEILNDFRSKSAFIEQDKIMYKEIRTAVSFIRDKKIN